MGSKFSVFFNFCSALSGPIWKMLDLNLPFLSLLPHHDFRPRSFLFARQFLSRFLSLLLKLKTKYWKEIFSVKDPGFWLSVLAGYGIDITNGIWNDGLDVNYSITAQFTGNRGFRGIALFPFQRIGFRNIGLGRGTHGSKVNATNLKSKI